jgi:phosphinothricin acetyltransferase
MMHAIAALYAWHVLTGASLKKIPRPSTKCASAMKTVADNGLPWLVALWRGIVAATAMPPLPSATRLSLYPGRVDLRGCQHHRARFWHALMDALIARCEQGPWRQMIGYRRWQ